jgi:monoamine oxidase
VAGDQVSYLPGWQEGAMLSAHHVLRRISRGSRMKMMAASTTKRHAPDTHALTQGSGRTRN